MIAKVHSSTQPQRCISPRSLLQESAGVLRIRMDWTDGVMPTSPYNEQLISAVGANASEKAVGVIEQL